MQQPTIPYSASLSREGDLLFLESVHWAGWCTATAAGVTAINLFWISATGMTLGMTAHA